MLYYFLLNQAENLEKHNIVYNPPYSKLFNLSSYAMLSGLLYSCYAAKENKLSQEIIQSNYATTKKEMELLEVQAKSGKDVLCCMAGSLYAVLPIFFELIQEYEYLSKCEVCPIFSLVPARENLHNLMHLVWKKMPFKEMFTSALEMHFLDKSDSVFDVLSKYCAKENIHTLFHNAYAPYVLDVDVVKEFSAIMNVPLNISQRDLDASMPFPSSVAGLDMSYVFSQFPFHLYKEQGFTKKKLYASLQETEKKEGFLPLDFTLVEDGKKLAESCAPAFKYIAKKLNRDKLFAQESKTTSFSEIPSGLLQIKASECLAFIENFPETWLKPILRYFRDLSTLSAEQEVFIQALEEYRQKKALYPEFVYPREKAKLTVITTCFNHEKYIGECIESVIAQKCDFPIEHIIVDDTSSDDTVKIIDSYADKYPHIRPVYLQYRNSTASSKNAFEICKSEYVSLCDGDDYFTDPYKLQKQVDLLEANKSASICFHPVQVLYEDDPQRKRIYPPKEALPRGVRPFYYLADLIKGNLIQTNSVVYRWRFQDGVPDWFRTDIVPGDWYWHLLHAEKGKIAYIDEIMSVYRRHKTALYKEGEESTVKHRLVHGMGELECFDAVSKHFQNKFDSELFKLTNGVFANYLQYYLENGDDSYLNTAVDQYPNFAKFFLSSLSLTKTPQSKDKHE